MKTILRFLLLVMALVCATPALQPLTGVAAGQSLAIDPRFQIPDSDEGLPGAGPIRRYDWFRKLWAERRSAWANRIEQDQHAVVFLGDSITQGWGDNLGGSFPG